MEDGRLARPQGIRSAGILPAVRGRLALGIACEGRY